MEHCFNFDFNNKFIYGLLLLVVFCLSISVVIATDINHDDCADSNENIYSDLNDSEINVKHINEDIGSNLDVDFDESNSKSVGNFNSKKYYNVDSEEDFKNVFYDLKSSSTIPKHVVINIVNDIKVKGSNIMSIDSNDTTFDIKGNCHTIKVSSPNEHAENHFLTCGSNANVFIHDLTLSGFNTAIINQGNLNLKDVTFDSNRLNYWVYEDYGGAIWSDGGLTCDHCTFINNSAKYGGSIYLKNSKKSTQLDKCYFYGNNAYGDGNDIYSNAIVIINMNDNVLFSYVFNNANFLVEDNDVDVDNNEYCYYPYSDCVYPNSTFIKEIKGSLNHYELFDGSILKEYYVFENTKYGKYVVPKENCNSVDILKNSTSK